ncbi:hypothetical protein chiPu_0001424 [Chiloscyllium punctatum]|uniref:Uncharacterized protein n=1 Tax=Chiloscyllium punctatum TaxID=137246 RepID=A0A401RY11_CHIPU|nr:hypothetical protein [Chiloscyllium punctatum]
MKGPARHGARAPPRAETVNGQSGARPAHRPPSPSLHPTVQRARVLQAGLKLTLCLPLSTGFKTKAQN